MANVVFSAVQGFGVDMTDGEFQDISDGEIIIATSTLIRVDYFDGTVADFIGTGFTLSTDGEDVTGGTLTDIEVRESGTTVVDASGFSAISGNGLDGFFAGQ